MFILGYIIVVSMILDLRYCLAVNAEQNHILVAHGYKIWQSSLKTNIYTTKIETQQYKICISYHLYQEMENLSKQAKNNTKN